MPLGFSFAPGSDIQMRDQQGNGSAPSKLSPQQAVKILSLRVPPALPSNAPVNRALLTSPGGSAAGASGLQSLIQQLMQSFRPQANLSGVLPSQSLPMTPTQAPATGPSQNVSQGPQFTGNYDTPPPGLDLPMFGGTGGGTQNALGNYTPLQILSQFSQPNSYLPRIIVDNEQLNNMLGSGVGFNRNV